jgi:hypothetical protein
MMHGNDCGCPECYDRNFDNFNPVPITHNAPTVGDTYCNGCGLEKQYWRQIPQCPVKAQQPATASDRSTMQATAERVASWPAWKQGEESTRGEVATDAELSAAIHQLLVEIRDHLYTKQDIARIRHMAAELPTAMRAESEGRS